MEVHVLGPLLVRTDRRTLVLASARERAVLTALALRPSTVVTVDGLQTALWGEEPPPSARKAIQTYVSSLRRALPPGSISTAPTGYVLDHPPDTVDAVRFKDLARQARARAAEGPDGRAAALAAFDAALALWRGEPLQDLADHPDNEAEVRRLVELHRALEEDRAQVRLDGGGHAAMVGGLEAAVAAEPLRERRWWQLMLALYRSGRQADALRAFQRLRDLLGEELGIEPSPELVALDQAILGQSPDLDLPPAVEPVVTAVAPVPTPAPAPTTAAEAVEVLGATAPRHRHNLPVELTSFVGRSRELAELAGLLDSRRLLTLTGPGGCGKTRLARAVATRRAEGGGPPDGIWFVDLTPLPAEAPAGGARGPDLVPGAVAGVLAVDVVADREPADTVVAALADRELLLVLDNCEHVVAGAAAFADRLLARAPRISVLATSREVLGVAGERAWPVPSLSLPEGDDDALPTEAADRSEAMQLFASRMPAPRALPELSAAERATMARIVRRLDGIPLAIELAAARTSVLSLAQLDERLDDRFRVLASGARTALPRHRTLAAAVEWSHDLLGPVEQAAFRRLAPFAGGFDLEAAETVVSAAADDGVDIDVAHVLDLVDSLVAKSLVTVETAGAELRYRLLETLRAFAATWLADAGDHHARHDAHLDWYLTLAVAAEPKLEGPAAPRWLGRLELEHDNLRAALVWAAGNGRAADGLELAVALRTFWDVRGHLAEGRRWLDRLVDAADDAPAGTRARGRLFAGELAARQGDLDGAARRYELAATAAATDDLPWVAGRELHDRAALAGLRGHWDEARGLLDRCLAIAHELDDDRLLARAYGNLGWIAVQQGDEGAAAPALDESLTRFRRLGDRQGVAWLLQYRGDLARRQGDLDGARALIEESFDLRIELADTYGLIATLESLAACLDLQGDRTGAAVLRDERGKLVHELGHRQPGGARVRRPAADPGGEGSGSGGGQRGRVDPTAGTAGGGGSADEEKRWRSSTAATTTS